MILAPLLMFLAENIYSLEPALTGWENTSNSPACSLAEDLMFAVLDFKKLLYLAYCCCLRNTFVIAEIHQPRKPKSQSSRMNRADGNLISGNFNDYFRANPNVRSKIFINFIFIRLVF